MKSSADLRVAVLRQEFVDELVPERLLKDEFMSVFKEENEIMESLRDSEQELEGKTLRIRYLHEVLRERSDEH